MESNVAIVSDPLLSEFGPTRPPLLIAEELVKRNFRVKIVSTKVTEDVKNLLQSKGISVFSLTGGKGSKNESLNWFKSWVMEVSFFRNSRKIPKLKGVALNFSNTIIVPSKCWYAQGPPTVTLKNIKGALATHYKLVYNLSSKCLEFLDKRGMKKFAENSEIVVANSNYLRDVYHSFGVKVSKVIYPPLDCQLFRSKRSNFHSDYILTYFGKEMKLTIIKKLADFGIDIVVFGGKFSAAPKWLIKHPKIRFLGRISNEKLVYLYSNALFTVYPFLDEPFGYIPIESMACGTPVLTFNKQGPSETVQNEITGWLAKTDEEMINLALYIWNNGYSSLMRKECERRARLFDKKRIVDEWMHLLRS
ncbi:MAG: glycosyltransferase [Candidatus Bathyarchaeia archaeon]